MVAYDGWCHVAVFIRGYVDECLDPEHYRARVPIFEPLNAKKLERPASSPGF